MIRIESYLEEVAEQHIPLPQEIDYRENFALVASEVQVRAEGLRAVVITRKLPDIPLHLVRHLENVSLVASVMEAPWSESVRFHTYEVDDDAETPGSVVKEHGDFIVTLPESDTAAGRRLSLSVGARSSALDAVQAERVRRRQA